jgi:imidazole glycerol-phosphate synthase subunit HisF
MKTVRVIPRLDIKGKSLVKGIHLEGLRVLGNPEEFAKYYFENGADELFYQDVVASLYGRNSLNEIISNTAKEIFIPLTVGGGIRNINDINAVLRSGADKVNINTAAISNPNFIYEASKEFGSSTITVSIEAIRNEDGRFLAYTDNGREYTGIDVTEWVKEVQDLGAGEIILTSVDREGTGTGFDLELIKSVSKLIHVPLIIHGGASSPENISKAILETNADGIAVSSILHYRLIRDNTFIYNSKNEGNTEFLASKQIFSKISSCTINDIKQNMYEKTINVRY